MHSRVTLQSTQNGLCYSAKYVQNPQIDRHHEEKSTVVALNSIQSPSTERIGFDCRMDGLHTSAAL